MVNLKAELFVLRKASGKGWEELSRDPMYIWSRLSDDAKLPIYFVSFMASSMETYTARKLIAFFRDMGIRDISEACQILMYLKDKGVLLQSRADKVCKYLLEQEATFKRRLDCIAWLSHIMSPAQLAAPPPASW